MFNFTSVSPQHMCDTALYSAYAQKKALLSDLWIISERQSLFLKVMLIFYVDLLCKLFGRFALLRFLCGNSDILGT